MGKRNSVEAKRGGTKTPNRRGLYAKSAKYAINAIELIVDLMENSKNDSVKLGAARTLLDKCLPDLKAVEMDPTGDKEIKIHIVSEGYMPPKTNR